MKEVRLNRTIQQYEVEIDELDKMLFALKQQYDEGEKKVKELKKAL